MAAFDSARVRALSDREWLVFDGYPGLRLHRHGKARTFLYRYRSPIDARLRQIRLGNWPAISWEKAVARWDDLRRRRDDGVDPQLDRRARIAQVQQQHAAERTKRKRDKVTVDRVIEHYLDGDVAKKVKSPKAVRSVMQRALDKFATRPAHSIDRAEAAEFLETVKAKVPVLARLLRARLGAAWDYAMRRRLLASDSVNPWRDALRGEIKAPRRTRYLDDNELVVFLDKVNAIDSGISEDVRDALLLTLYTAARSGEVVAMDWSAVDLKRGTWTLHTTKEDAPRTIRLPRQALAILRRRNAGFSITQPRLSEALRAVNCFGLRSSFKPHDLRRSARTGLARLGVPAEVCEAALGHIEGGIEGVYNLHKYEREVGEALQRWCDHLDALAAPEVIALPTAKTA